MSAHLQLIVFALLTASAGAFAGCIINCILSDLANTFDRQKQTVPVLAFVLAASVQLIITAPLVHAHGTKGLISLAAYLPVTLAVLLLMRADNIVRARQQNTRSTTTAAFEGTLIGAISCAPVAVLAVVQYGLQGGLVASTVAPVIITFVVLSILKLALMILYVLWSQLPFLSKQLVRKGERISRRATELINHA